MTQQGGAGREPFMLELWELVVGQVKSLDAHIESLYAEARERNGLSSFRMFEPTEEEERQQRGETEKRDKAIAEYQGQRAAYMVIYEKLKKEFQWDNMEKLLTEVLP